MLMRYSKCSFVVVVSALLAFGVEARANVTLSDFSSFNLTGTYVQWDFGTFTSNATDFQVQATDFGGGFYVLPSAVNASGNSLLEVQLDINAGNVADKFNVVLIDADGTERVYRFDNLSNGAGQTLTKNVANFLQDNAPGTTPGLDLSNLTVFHLQGTFENGIPGLAQDLTFDNLALIVPEPATISLLGLACVAVLCRRNRS